MILTVTANPTIDRVYFIDDFKTGKVHRAKRISRSAGGKGLNVARVAAILGAKTGAMGFVGGYTGDFILSEIEKQGIGNFFTYIKGETRTCVNITDKAGISSEMLEEGPEILQEEKDRFIKTYTACVDDFDVICISGSLPKGLTGNFYRELICLAKKRKRKVIVDTVGNVLEELLTAEPYMVKPNQDELSVLMNREITTDDDIKEALWYLLKKGVEVPFFSMGKDGAATLINGCCYRFLSPDVEVVNAVGSGDSTVAGVAAGLDMGYTIEDAMKLGMAAGIANTQFEQTGIVTKELVENFYNLVQVKKI